jgi:hypothetical protein
MKKYLFFLCTLISLSTEVSFSQVQYPLDKASTSPTTASPGVVFGWPNWASQNFLYDGEFINLYGLGFHDYNDGTSIGGINSYVSSYFGIDFFTAGQRRFRINANGNVGIGTTSSASKLEVLGQTATGKSQNGTTNDYEALSVYNTPASTLPSGNGAVIQFYNNCSNTNINGNFPVYGASIKSVSVNNQYGWESDLYLRTTRNNGYTPPQTILDALIIKGGTGNVGIGTTNPQQKLHVKGTVYSTEVKVDVAAGTGPDYVFSKNYQLPTLDYLKSYIAQHQHLPEVPSAKEMEAKGVNLGEMNLLLIKKIEELTLYQFQLLDKIEALEVEVSKLSAKSPK